ncbi:hypothetical protein IWX65_003330 [Arthrobacter sp. CAN_A214]|uniref:hypothetical protein n=1 Tax=Arthrobacter sp. CAN_A214 TaxID=2787720 RepID=UPI0018CB8AD3
MVEVLAAWALARGFSEAVLALARGFSEAVLAPAVVLVLVPAERWGVLGALMWVSGLVLVVLGR